MRYLIRLLVGQASEHPCVLAHISHLQNVFWIFPCGKSSGSWVNLRRAFPPKGSGNLRPRRHSRQRDCFGFAPNSLLGRARRHRKGIFNQFIISATPPLNNKNRTLMSGDRGAIFIFRFSTFCSGLRCGASCGCRGRQSMPQAARRRRTCTRWHMCPPRLVS